MRKIIPIILLSIAIGAKAQENHYFQTARNLDLFNSIYSDLDMMYVDTLDASRTIGVAIRSMLSSLDPYTEYFPSDQSKDLRMMFTGKYAGIGALVKYHFSKKSVVIDEPYEGMPAAAAGLRKGDVILAIDDSSMTGKTTSYVSQRLRGNANSTFKLKILRPSTGKEITMRITRKSIKLPELPYYGVLPLGDGHTGYIDFDQYTEGSARDFRRAFIDLRDRGATSLIIDLRSNGGGALSEAIDICSMFLPKGIVLVETRGKMKQANSQFKTRVEPIDTVMPIVVLVNGETASASEITCGSLQDMDRGVVLGTRTYGKGLVQTAVDLPYNANMKITTSKYYIPSGRCIQAVNYKHDGTGYQEHIPDSLTRLFHTAGGREVRDGGGVKPDIEVKADTMTAFVARITGADWYYERNIDSTMVLFDYVTDYIASHPSIAPPGEFHLTDTDYENFKQRVLSSAFNPAYRSRTLYESLVRELKHEGLYNGAEKEAEALAAKIQPDISEQLDINKEDLMRILEHEIVTAYYYQKGAIEATLKYDNQLKEAVRLLDNPEEYNKLLGK